MTRRQSAWITGLIVALVLLLRVTTLWPSMYLVDEAYYGTIANDMLDGGKVYHTAVDTKPPGMYYVYAAVFALAGRNNLRAVHLLAMLVVIATALTLRRTGARLANEWAGAWAGLGYVLFLHAYLPRDTLAANSEIFALLPVSLSVLAFLRGERGAVIGWMILSGALSGVATLVRQPCALQLALLLACLGYGWLWLRQNSLGRTVAAGVALIAGFVAPIAGLALYYQTQGNLEDAYHWALTFALRYVGSETTVPYVLHRLATVHLTVLLSWALLVYFAARQVVTMVKRLRREGAVSTGEFLLLLWLGVAYLTVFIGWRFPGHYHLVLLPPLCLLGGEALADFLEGEGSDRRWRWRRRLIAGAAALPALAYLVVAFVVRESTLDFYPLTDRIAEETAPNDRIFVWGSYPQLYSFSGRGMATRFVSCTHLTGSYASRPREVKDSAEPIMPGVWKMFQQDWNSHPPVLIIDLSTASPDWQAHPMTRYPALAEKLPGYRLESVINGATIYRRF